MSNTDNTKPFRIQVAESAGFQKLDEDEKLYTRHCIGIGGSSGVKGLAQEVRSEYITRIRHAERQFRESVIGYVYATEGVAYLIEREKALKDTIEKLYDLFSSSPEEVVEELESAIAELVEIETILDDIYDQFDFLPIRGFKKTIPWDLS